MSYDHFNIFARMLRGEVPSRVIFENEYVFAFHDIFPRAPIHALVIPKGAYMNAYDFQTHASADEIVGFYRGLSQTIDLLDVKDSGFRLVSNTGVHAHQEVPHFHVHILGGAILGSLPTFLNATP
jgi:histidine triad (HIT) family protein